MGAQVYGLTHPRKESEEEERNGGGKEGEWGKEGGAEETAMASLRAGITCLR